MFIGRPDVEAETPILWPPDVKADLFEKTLMLGGIGGRRRRGRQKKRCLDGIINSIDMSLSKLQDGQGGLACYSPWGSKEADMTEPLN